MKKQTCNFCKNPESILSKETCCSGCSKIKDSYQPAVKKYTLTLTEDQARALSEAAELVSRLHMGQLDCLEIFNKFPDNFEEVHYLLENLREEMNLIPDGCSKNAYYGISSPDISNRARTLFDAHQVIRHQIWKNTPSMDRHTTWASPAMKTDATQDLPTIK